MPDQMTPAAFAAAIKAKHPEYRGVADDVLVKAMLDKFPQYKDQIQSTQALSGKVSDSEPGTFMGGFLKSLNDQATNLGNSLFRSAARPSSIGDFLSLMLPGTTEALASPVAKTADTALRSGIQKTGAGIEKAGIAARPSSLPLAVTDAMVRGKPGEALTIAAAPYAAQGAGKALQAVSHLGEEPSVLSQIDRFGGNTSGYVPGAAAGDAAAPILGNINDMPLHQQMEHMPTSGPMPDPGRVQTPPLPRKGPALGRVASTGPAPATVEDALLQALLKGDEGATAAGETSTLPPAVETAGEGPLKQSGKFGKSGNLGQAGGYSSGRPGVTSDRYDELAAKPTEPSVENVPDEAPVQAGDPQALRDQVGSEDAAKKLGISVDDLKAKTAQGPYGLPADARARIDAALEALTAQGRTPAELDQYIAQASPLARLYITAKLGQ